MNKNYYEERGALHREFVNIVHKAQGSYESPWMYFAKFSNGQALLSAIMVIIFFKTENLVLGGSIALVMVVAWFMGLRRIFPSSYFGSRDNLDLSDEMTNKAYSLYFCEHSPVNKDNPLASIEDSEDVKNLLFSREDPNNTRMKFQIKSQSKFLHLLNRPIGDPDAENESKEMRSMRRLKNFAIGLKYFLAGYLTIMICTGFSSLSGTIVVGSIFLITAFVTVICLNKATKLYNESFIQPHYDRAVDEGVMEAINYTLNLTAYDMYEAHQEGAGD